MEKPGVWVYLWMFCFVQIALWTVPCFSADLGEACASNENCTVANSACVTNTCTCEATHYQLNATTCAQKIAPGEGCDASGGSDQCVGNATCPGSGASPVCECGTDFYPNAGQCSERIKVGQTCTGNATHGNCISSALCETADNTCRYKLNQACTVPPPGSPNPCQEGAQCANVNGASPQCKIKVGSSLPCNTGGDCVPSATCEGNTCKTKLNEQCNAASPNCQANTTCVDVGQGGPKCRRDYGSSCTDSSECQESKHEACLGYDSSSSQKKCLCSEQHFRLNSSICKSVSSLEAEDVNQTGEKMETSITIEWKEPSELTPGKADYRARAVGSNADQWSTWSHSLTATFTVLTPGEQYQVSVQTRIRKDPAYGNQTVEKTTANHPAYTKPAKPGKLIPQNYSAPDVTLKFNSSDGKVENYTVTVDGKHVDVVAGGGGQQTASFTNLVAGRAYNVTIIAISHYLMSDAQTDSFSVGANRSGEVIKLNAVSGSRWSEVSWKKPDRPNGQIMGYTVKLLDSQDVCVSGVAVSIPGHNFNPSTAGCSSRGNTTLTDPASQPFKVNVTGLHPDVEYTVRVSAYNEVGEGNPKNVKTRTKSEAALTLKSLSLSTPGVRQILIEWTPGERTGPTNYTVTWKEKESLSSSNYSLKSSMTVSGYHNTNLTISQDLLSYWEYEVSVFPVTSVPNPPANTSTQTVTTQPTEPEAVSFTITQLVDSAEKVNLTAHCPEEKKRNGPIESIVYSANVIKEGAYNKPVPSGSIRVSESQCGGSTILDVAAETNYNFTVFAKTPFYEGKPSREDITISPLPPKLEKPPGVSALVTPRENRSSSVVLEICDCVVSPTQGSIVLAGITACVQSPSENCQPKQGASLADYGSLPNWKKFFGGDQKGRYRVTNDEFFKGVTPGTGTRSFTVGENSTCGQETKSTFCNGPLPGGREFVIIIWACTEAGCTEARGVSVKTLSGGDSSSSVGGIVGGVVGVVVGVAVVAAVVAVVVLRRKKKACFSSYDHPETLPDMPPVRKPVKLRDFAAHLERLHKDSNLLFQEEFEDIQERSPKHFPQEAAVVDANKVKNRYVNILPFDHTRVKLTIDDDDDTSDFINANYIPGYTSPREYIATQGPMVGTFSHFWKMLWEQKASLIVMLSDLQEKGRPKVDMYWPGEMHSPVQYDDTVVELTSVSTLNKYTIRTFNVYKEDQKEEVRRVAQYFIPGWEDYSANLNPDDVLDFISSVRLEARASQGPIIVHCSAGVGRTGTFIALDFLMQYVREHEMEDTVDIYNLVLNMRHNRPLMVQSEKQYIFIHDTLRVIIERKKREAEEHIYGNTCLEDIYVNQAFEPEENLYENTGFKPTTSL